MTGTSGTVNHDNVAVVPVLKPRQNVRVSRRITVVTGHDVLFGCEAVPLQPWNRTAELWQSVVITAVPLVALLIVATHAPQLLEEIRAAMTQRP